MSDTYKETDEIEPIRDSNVIDYKSELERNNIMIMSNMENNEDSQENTAARSLSPEPDRCNPLPYIRFASPVKGGRKVLGNIVSVMILLVSSIYTVDSIIYYSDPPHPISKGLANALKEIVCFLLAVLLVMSRFFPPKCRENILCRLFSQNRETVSLMLGVAGAIVHFYALIRWYVQEGQVYVWQSDNGLTYTLDWNVKLIMCSLLVDFILNFIEFSLMLLTKMRPKYKDLNPHLTAFIEKQKLLDHAAPA